MQQRDFGRTRPQGLGPRPRLQEAVGELMVRGTAADRGTRCGTCRRGTGINYLGYLPRCTATVHRKPILAASLAS